MRASIRRDIKMGLLAAALLLAALALLAPALSQASIPDADIQPHVNQGGFGMITGVYGRADFGLDERSAIGGYFGTDPNDVYFNDFGAGDHRFSSDALVGGHYMYQFVEGGVNEPNVAGIFGAFANRSGLRPELGVALSYPFDARWTGRANVVYGPSWGFEMAYRFNPTVEGTIGVTGLGLIGVGFRF
jgi:hypothetical protein